MPYPRSPYTPRRPRQQGQSSDDILANPPAPSSGDEPTPIGVPPGYEPGKVTFEDPDEELFGRPDYPKIGEYIFEGSRQLRYYEGDQWGPARWSSERILEMQQELVKAGLVTPGTKLRYGFYDEPTLAAFEWLLVQGNLSGRTWDVVLETVLADPDAYQTVGAQETAPFSARVSDPVELQQLFREATINLTGEGWSQGQIDSMVKAYQDLEVQRQRELYEAQTPAPGEQYGPGGIVTEPMTPAAFIEQRIREEDPLAIPEHQLLGHAQEALQMLTSPAWGVGLR